MGPGVVLKPSCDERSCSLEVLSCQCLVVLIFIDARQVFSLEQTIFHLIREVTQNASTLHSPHVHYSLKNTMCSYTKDDILLQSLPF